MSVRILLVEDDPAVASLIRRTLQEENYEVTVAMDGNSGWEFITRFEYELFILDVMMPGISGIELCKRIRREGIRTSILLLTALGSVDNIVMGLDSGADDYLTKPFKIAELLARLRSLLRKYTSGTAGEPETIPSPAVTPDQTQPSTIVYADLELNLDEKNLKRGDRLIDLTATEFRLLEYLMRNPRKVLSRMDILEKVWGYDFNMNTKVVDVYINYLRKKLEDPGSERLIRTVVGMGYILKEE